MPIILGVICLLPLLVGAAVQYLAHRLLRRRLLRLIPAASGAALALLVAAGRWSLWTSQEVSPLTQILFVPVLPALCYAAGLILGRSLYKRLWTPRVVDDRQSPPGNN